MATAVDLMDTTPSDSDSNFQSAQLEDGPERSHCNANEREVMERPSVILRGHS